MSGASGISPLDLKVLVKPIEVEQVTPGGIIKPQTAADKEKYALTKGTLISAGPNAFKEWGSGNEPNVGSLVIFAQYAGLRMKGDDGHDYLVLNDADVIAEAAK